MMMTETAETKLNGVYYNGAKEQAIVRTNGLGGLNTLWRVTTFMYVKDGYTGRTTIRERTRTYDNPAKLRTYLERKGYFGTN